MKKLLLLIALLPVMAYAQQSGTPSGSTKPQNQAWINGSGTNAALALYFGGAQYFQIPTIVGNNSFTGTINSFVKISATDTIKTTSNVSVGNGSGTKGIVINGGSSGNGSGSQIGFYNGNGAIGGVGGFSAVGGPTVPYDNRMLLSGAFGLALSSNTNIDFIVAGGYFFNFNSKARYNSHPSFGTSDSLVHVDKKYVDAAIAAIPAGGVTSFNSRTGAITPLVGDYSSFYEVLTNKSTTTTLGTSNTLYPTQNAVKTYVDNAIASIPAGGVTSITGTANQVIASSSTGAITLSLPQSIGTGNTPNFSGLKLTNTTKPTGASGYGIIYMDSVGRHSWVNPNNYKRTLAARRPSDQVYTFPWRSNPTFADSTDIATVYQPKITLTTTGTGAATFVGNTLNIPTPAGSTYTNGYGLSLSSNTFSVDTTSATAIVSKSRLNTALALKQNSLGNFTTGRVLFGQGTSMPLTSTNLFWDNTNSRLGISNSSPSFAIDMSASSGANYGVHISNSGGGTTDNAAVSLANSTLNASFFTTTAANSLGAAAGLYTNAPNGFTFTDGTLALMRLYTTGTSKGYLTLKNIGAGTVGTDSILVHRNSDGMVRAIPATAFARPTFVVVANGTMALGTDYLNSSATQYQLTLPATAGFATDGSKIITVLCTGTGGAKILVPSGYAMQAGTSFATTTGTGGATLTQGQKVQLIPVGTNSYYLQALNGSVTVF